MERNGERGEGKRMKSVRSPCHTCYVCVVQIGRLEVEFAPSGDYNYMTVTI